MADRLSKEGAVIYFFESGEVASNVSLAPEQVKVYFELAAKLVEVSVVTQQVDAMRQMAAQQRSRQNILLPSHVG